MFRILTAALSRLSRLSSGGAASARGFNEIATAHPAHGGQAGDPAQAVRAAVAAAAAAAAAAAVLFALPSSCVRTTVGALLRALATRLQRSRPLSFYWILLSRDVAPLRAPRHSVGFLPAGCLLGATNPGIKGPRARPPKLPPLPQYLSARSAHAVPSHIDSRRGSVSPTCASATCSCLAPCAAVPSFPKRWPSVCVMSLQLMPFWNCPHCNWEFSSVLVRTAERCVPLQLLAGYTHLPHTHTKK